MSSITDSWETFFRNCGLPKNVHRKYAQRFVKERIQPSMLKDIGKSELSDLGVETLGDQLCILRYVKSTDGILDEFNGAAKQRSTTTARANEDDLDDIYMDSDFSDFDDAPEPAPVVKVQPSAQSRKVTSKEKKEPISSRGVASQSRVIRKKPVMIHDVSSSSPLPIVGKMRSDAISMKTMVVADNSSRRGPQNSRRAAKSVVSRSRNMVDDLSRRESRVEHVRRGVREPDFRVNLNIRPQVRYDGTFMDDNGVDFEDADIPTARGSQIVSVSSNGVRRLSGNVVREVDTRRSLAVDRPRPVIVGNGRRPIPSSPAVNRTVASRVTRVLPRNKPVVTLPHGRGNKFAANGGGGSGGILSRVSILPK